MMKNTQGELAAATAQQHLRDFDEFDGNDEGPDLVDTNYISDDEDEPSEMHRNPSHWSINNGEAVEPAVGDGGDGGCLKSMADLRLRAAAIANSNWFGGLIAFTIVFAGLVIGVQTYIEDGEENLAIEVIDGVILTIFAFECAVKITAGGFYNYFFGKDRSWNRFDFSIVAACIIVPFVIEGEATGSIIVLRLVRLLRVLKLLHTFSQLQIIIRGLMGGMASMGYILVVLFFVIFIYACCGCFFFQLNDPFHFDDFLVATVTLWELASLEWAEVMRASYYGCVSDTEGQIYTIDCNQTLQFVCASEKNNWCLCADSETGVISREAATTASNLRSTFGIHASTAEVNCPGVTMRIAVNDPKPYYSSAYFLTFVMLASWVMLSLFMGAVTTAMNVSILEMKMAKVVATQKKAREAGRRKIMGVDARGSLARMMSVRAKQLVEISYVERLVTCCTNLKSLVVSPDYDFRSLQEIVQNKQDLAKLNTTLRERYFREQDAQTLLESMFKGEHLDLEPSSPKAATRGISQRKSSITAIVQRKGREQKWAKDIEEHTFWTRYADVALRCDSIASNRWFSNLIALAIIIVTIILALQTNSIIAADETLISITGYTEWMFTMLFTMEALVKIMAEGFQPLHYFTDPWNSFDFSVSAHIALELSMLVLLLDVCSSSHIADPSREYCGYRPPGGRRAEPSAHPPLDPLVPCAEAPAIAGA
jgi:hypothetical protein